MCDEYRGYGNIDCGLLQSCWAHARRYVEQAQQVEPRLAAEVLVEVGKLYTLEKQIRDLVVAQRQAARTAQALPQLEQIFNLIGSQEFRPASPMYKA